MDHGLVPGLEPPQVFEALEAAPHPVVIYEVDAAEFRVVFVNEAAVAASGLGREGHIGHVIGPEADRAGRGVERRRILQKIVESGKTIVSLESAEFPDRNITFDAHRTPLFTADGDITHIVGHFLNITPEVRAESALILSEHRFDAMFDHSPLAVALYAADGTCRRANPAMCALVGRTEAELLRLKWSDITHPDDCGEAFDWSTDPMPEGPLEMEKRYLRPDGSAVWARICVSSLEDESGNRMGAIAQCIDITDLKEGTTALEEALRMRDRTVATVSHEIRTPLTGIVGFVDLLREGREPREERLATLDVIADQASELLGIVDDLLIAARAETGTISVEATPLDVSEACRDVVDGLPPAWRRSVAIAGDDVAAIGDPPRVRQVVRNLVTNAIRHGGAGITVRIAAEGDRAVVEVADNGPGIPPEDEELVFEAFRQSERRSEGGCGLGLAVSRHLARAMGGEVVYRRDAGETVFELTLPAD